MVLEEVEIHRLRFGDWTPSAIKSLACDKFSSRFAIGRDDGDIEICNASMKWITQARISGRTDFKLQSLIWATAEQESGRLFGISLRGFIFEVDIPKLSIKNIRDSYGGAVWCFAACPRKPLLAVGCEDGSVRIFTYDCGALEYKSTLPTTGCRVLSIAYHPLQSKLYLGCADGTIRCIDEDTGYSLFRMTGDILKGIDTLIWSLIVLSDSTVASGDSRGHLQLWDGENGSLILTIHQHTAEVLSIITNCNETKIFASGVDSRVICIQKLTNQIVDQKDILLNNSNSNHLKPRPIDSTWVYSSSHRPHSHDINTLAMCNINQLNYNSQDNSYQTTTESYLLSGGLDCKLCYYLVNNFTKFRPVSILPSPTKGLILTSEDQSVLAMQHRHYLDIRKFNKKINNHKNKKIKNDCNSSNNDKVIDKCPVEGVSLDVRIQLKGDQHINCSALDDTGSILVASNNSGTKIWKLLHDNDTIKVEEMKICGVDLNRLVFQRLAFSLDSKLLAGYSIKGSLVLIDIATESLRTVDHKREVIDYYRSTTRLGSFVGTSQSGGGLELVVSNIAFSADGRFIAVADAHHGIYIYDLDSLRLFWRVPDFTSFVTVLKFQPSLQSSILIVVLSSNAIILLDVEQCHILPRPWSIQVNNSDGSNNNSNPSSTGLSLYEVGIPSYLLLHLNPLEGISFKSPTDNILFLYGKGIIVYVNIQTDAPKQLKIITTANNHDETIQGKRYNEESGFWENSAAGNAVLNHNSTTRVNEQSNNNFTVLDIYRSIIHVGHISSKEMVVVENPWVHIMDALPDTLARKKYGT